MASCLSDSRWGAPRLKPGVSPWSEEEQIKLQPSTNCLESLIFIFTWDMTTKIVSFHVWSQKKEVPQSFPSRGLNVIAQIITGVQNYYYNQQCLWHHTENDTHFPVFLQTWILSDTFRKKYVPFQRSACSHWCNLKHLAQHRTGLPSQPHNVEAS